MFIVDDLRWKKFPVLDLGCVALVDVMGDDSSVVQAARVSYGDGTKKVSDDRTLIRYLLRNYHTTPFEMVEFKFYCKMPIFVARQWIRHRTANVNEISGRYSEMKDEFYVPDPSWITRQDQSNRQGGSDDPVDDVADMADGFRREASGNFVSYSGRIVSGMRKELARINLPLSTYTEWYWKIDLHNLMHFLRLRLDSHAQREIRVYGEAMAQIVRQCCPVSWEAFEDYRLQAMSLSRLDIEAIKAVLDKVGDSAFDHIENKREREECLAKLRRLGVL
jgi:thymidylate synthase (FAD)